MTFDNSILSIVTFLPIVGVIAVLLVPGRDERSLEWQRWIALVTTIVTFAISLVIWARFDPSTSDFQFVVDIPLVGQTIGYRMGVDGISVMFIVLTALLMPACQYIAISATSIRTEPRKV
jgi:NADH-quinone oxidoreductase subunit M